MGEENTVQMGSKFDPKLVSDLFNLVRGHSALAKLSAQKPIPFTGEKEFTFSMNEGVQIVGESKQKKQNTIEMEPKVIKPVKMVYQARFSDEFLRASSEQKLNYLKAFTEGAAVQYAKALDYAAIHGMNPYTGEKATFYDTNSFDGQVGNVTAYDATKVDDQLDEAINSLDEVNGIALSKRAGADMGKIKANGIAVYPEFRFGGNPASFAGKNCDVSETISAGPIGEDVEPYEDFAIVGDFQNAFRWGYADGTNGDSMNLECITMGDPDQTGRDLKAYNEVCLRLETYIGWGLLNADDFAILRYPVNEESV